MNRYQLISLLVLGLLLLGNYRLSAKEIYKNVEYSGVDRVATISLYEGESEKYLVPYKKYIIAYTQDGFPTGKIILTWNKESRDWKQTEKYMYQYDVNNNLYSLTLSTWSQKNEQWGDQVKYAAYLFDLDIDLLAINTISR